MTPEAPPSNTQKLTINDACAYLKAVEVTFQDKVEKNDEIHEIVNDFKRQRIGISGVIMRMKELFKGHCELILGFNTFLPTGHENKLIEKNKSLGFEEALHFVNKIKNRFENEEPIYEAFLDILKMFRMKNKSVKEVYQEFAVLFQSHLDLLEEFKKFLPNTFATTDLQHPSSSIRPVLKREESDINPANEMNGRYGACYSRRAKGWVEAA